MAPKSKGGSDIGSQNGQKGQTAFPNLTPRTRTIQLTLFGVLGIAAAGIFLWAIGLGEPSPVHTAAACAGAAFPVLPSLASVLFAFRRRRAVYTALLWICAISIAGAALGTVLLAFIDGGLAQIQVVGIVVPLFIMVFARLAKNEEGLR